MLAAGVPGVPYAPPNQVNRKQAYGYQPAAVTYAVPPATVARYQPAPYQPAPYQFPAGSPQLAGTPIVPPPGPPPPAAVPLTAPPMIAQQPLPPPPTQWGPAPQQMPPQLVPQPLPLGLPGRQGVLRGPPPRYCGGVATPSSCPALPGTRSCSVAGAMATRW
jgi:hypothetical protein